MLVFLFGTKFAWRNVQLLCWKITMPRARFPFACLFIGLISAGAAHANPSLAIIDTNPGEAPVAQLEADGHFSSITNIDVSSSTPTLAQLQGHSAILVYTTFPPANATALGNVLQQYVQGGGSLVLAAYALSSTYGISGGIMTTGYSPLTDLGNNGDVSGNLVEVAPSPVFYGINLSTLSYFHNQNLAQPGLDAGATLLATDGAGVDMIAVNAANDVIADNLFPGVGYGDSPELYQLLANELRYVSGNPIVAPEPSSLLVVGSGLVGLGLRRRRTRG